MVARDFTELVAWQLADALRTEVIALTSNPVVARDFKYCNQIRASADSACSNTAEGFGRFRPKEFQRFLGIAKGSLTETQDHLLGGRGRGFLDAAELTRLMTLAKRAIAANAKLQTYLRHDGRHGPKVG